MTRRKISRDENASTLTSLNGFKNIKSKVIEPKKIVETSNIQK